MTGSSPSSGLVSLGYEGRSAEQVVALLQAQQVGVLIDVRLNAVSRKPGLSKRALGAALADAGIRYVHEPELGNPQDNREAFREGEPDALDRYQRHMMNKGASALSRVCSMAEEERIALLCYELVHSQCHRSVIVAAVQGCIPDLCVFEV